MSFTLHVVLGKTKDLQCFNEEFPRSHDHTLEVTSMFGVFGEEFRRVIDLEPCCPSLEESFESGNVKSLIHGFIVGNVLELQLDFTLFLLAELLQDYPLARLQSLQSFLLDQSSQFCGPLRIPQCLFMFDLLVFLRDSSSEFRLEQLVISAQLEILIQQFVINLR